MSIETNVLFRQSKWIRNALHYPRHRGQQRNRKERVSIVPFWFVRYLPPECERIVSRIPKHFGELENRQHWATYSIFYSIAIIDGSIFFIVIIIIIIQHFKECCHGYFGRFIITLCEQNHVLFDANNCWPCRWNNENLNNWNDIENCQHALRTDG